MSGPLARRLRKAILAVDGVALGESVFDPGEEAFYVNSKQMGGIHDGAIGLRVTKEVVRERRPELKADPRVTIPYSGSDWITVTFTSPADLPFVLELADAAARRYRPPPGVPSKPPPTGGELERRRQWH